MKLKSYSIKSTIKSKRFIWGTIVLINFLMFSFITDRSVFSFLPSWPVSDDRIEAFIYLPDVDSKELLKEKRKIEEELSREEVAYQIVKMVIKGSEYENTSIMVPIEGMIRKIWFHNGTCVIDFDLEQFDKDVKIIPGSSEMFQKALEKSIKENMKDVKSVLLLEHGVPLKKMWN